MRSVSSDDVESLTLRKLSEWPSLPSLPGLKLGIKVQFLLLQTLATVRRLH